MPRTVLDGLKDLTGDKALSPTNTQVEEQEYPKLKDPSADALEPMNPTELKAAFAALLLLAKQLKEFRTHLIQSKMKVEELDLSSINLQLATSIKLIIKQQNSNHTDTLMEANIKFTDNLSNKLKAHPAAALPKDDQDNITQLFKLLLA
eukprot:jgi/Psemu1/21776/gm1.21776_g